MRWFREFIYNIFFCFSSCSTSKSIFGSIYRWFFNWRLKNFQIRLNKVEKILKHDKDYANTVNNNNLYKDILAERSKYLTKLQKNAFKLEDYINYKLKKDHSLSHIDIDNMNKTFKDYSISSLRKELKKQKDTIKIKEQEIADFDYIYKEFTYFKHYDNELIDEAFQTISSNYFSGAPKINLLISETPHNIISIQLCRNLANNLLDTLQSDQNLYSACSKELNNLQMLSDLEKIKSLEFIKNNLIFNNNIENFIENSNPNIETMNFLDFNIAMKSIKISAIEYINIIDIPKDEKALLLKFIQDNNISYSDIKAILNRISSIDKKINILELLLFNINLFNLNSQLVTKSSILQDEKKIYIDVLPKFRDLYHLQEYELVEAIMNRMYYIGNLQASLTINANVVKFNRSIYDSFNQLIQPIKTCKKFEVINNTIKEILECLESKKNIKMSKLQNVLNNLKKELINNCVSLQDRNQYLEHLKQFETNLYIKYLNNLIGSSKLDFIDNLQNKIDGYIISINSLKGYNLSKYKDSLNVIEDYIIKLEYLKNSLAFSNLNTSKKNIHENLEILLNEVLSNTEKTHSEVLDIKNLLNSINNSEQSFSIIDLKSIISKFESKIKSKSKKGSILHIMCEFKSQVYIAYIKKFKSGELSKLDELLNNIQSNNSNYSIINEELNKITSAIEHINKNMEPIFDLHNKIQQEKQFYIFYINELDKYKNIKLNQLETSLIKIIKNRINELDSLSLDNLEYHDVRSLEDQFNYVMEILPDILKSNKSIINISNLVSCILSGKITSTNISNFDIQNILKDFNTTINNLNHNLGSSQILKRFETTLVASYLNEVSTPLFKLSDKLQKEITYYSEKIATYKGFKTSCPKNLNAILKERIVTERLYQVKKLYKDISVDKLDYLDIPKSDSLKDLFNQLIFQSTDIEDLDITKMKSLILLLSSEPTIADLKDICIEDISNNFQNNINNTIQKQFKNAQLLETFKAQLMIKYIDALIKAFFVDMNNKLQDKKLFYNDILSKCDTLKLSEKYSYFINNISDVVGELYQISKNVLNKEPFDYSVLEDNYSLQDGFAAIIALLDEDTKSDQCVSNFNILVSNLSADKNPSIDVQDVLKRFEDTLIGLPNFNNMQAWKLLKNNICIKYLQILIKSKELEHTLLVKEQTSSIDPKKVEQSIDFEVMQLKLETKYINYISKLHKFPVPNKNIFIEILTNLLDDVSSITSPELFNDIDCSLEKCFQNILNNFPSSINENIYIKEINNLLRRIKDSNNSIYNIYNTNLEISSILTDIGLSDEFELDKILNNFELEINNLLKTIDDPIKQTMCQRLLKIFKANICTLYIDNYIEKLSAQKFEDMHEKVMNNISGLPLSHKSELEDITDLFSATAVPEPPKISGNEAILVYEAVKHTFPKKIKHFRAKKIEVNGDNCTFKYLITESGNKEKCYIVECRKEISGENSKLIITKPPEVTQKGIHFISKHSKFRIRKSDVPSKMISNKESPVSTINSSGSPTVSKQEPTLM